MNSFQSLVDRFSADPSDTLMGQLVARVEQKNWSDEDLAYLTVKLAESGETLSHTSDKLGADIASTGGPASLSTLLCPLYLRALGHRVPTLAVPGRPAGGIDVLAQIPRYKIHFTRKEALDVLEKCGYIHFLASDLFAPLDAALFRFRKQHAKINVAALAIPSLLSKKKAAGVSLVGLDVRVAAHGNFGATFPSAQQNARLFCDVARLIGFEAVCFLTDGNRPYQPFIGRGEALLALSEIFAATAEPWLSRHSDMCYAMAHRLSSLNSKAAAIVRPTSQHLLAVFAQNLEAQGSATEHFEAYVFKVRGQEQRVVTASRSGFLDVDLGSLRTEVLRYQLPLNTPAQPFPDPCGITLKQVPGSFVRKGDVVAVLRCSNSFAEDFHSAVAAALPIKQEPPYDIYFNEIRCE